MVMVGHYLELYRGAQSFTPHIYILDMIFKSKVAFLLNQNYWVYLFYAVSGYLVAKSKISNIRELLVKSVNRFLRLAFPIFFSYALIYLIYIAIGFHASETTALFNCEWFQTHYTRTYSIVDVLISPIAVLLFGSFKMNEPYWMLHDMFVASLIIYFLKYLIAVLDASKYESITFSLLIIITILFNAVSPCVSTCLMGMLISLYEKSDINTKPCFAFWIVIMTMVIGILPATIRQSLFFAALIAFTPRLKLLDSLLSSKPLQFIGNISWGIYSFHWPIFGSIGALLLLAFCDQMGLVKAYFSTFIISFVVVVLISIGFYYTFERISKVLSQNVMGLISTIVGER